MSMVSGLKNLHHWGRREGHTKHKKHKKRFATLLQCLFWRQISEEIYFFFFFNFLFVSFSRNKLPLLEGAEVKEKKKKKARRLGGHIWEVAIYFSANHSFWDFFFHLLSLFWKGGGKPWDVCSGKTRIPFILYVYKSLKTLESVMACKGVTVKL